MKISENLCNSWLKKNVVATCSMKGAAIRNTANAIFGLKHKEHRGHGDIIVIRK